MENVINIVLGGSNIAIAESANAKVQAYIESLRQYFNNEEGRDEIIADIEARFAELMNEKLKNGAPHITDAEVDEMIAQIGRPEDFEKADVKSSTGPQTPFAGAGKGRLYRDGNNKVLGGVCSGLANWLKMDPTLVRVLFAIISFGGFGTGILIYIALWIFLPVKDMEKYPGRKMYRNPDDKWFGGVASGLSAYFNTNPTLFRCVFGIPVLLSAMKTVNILGHFNDFDILPNLFFSGITGTLVFIYVILWIVLPEAVTPPQKMEMFGQGMDRNGFKQNMKTTMENFGDRMQNWSKEVQDSAEKLGQQAGGFANSRGKEFGQEVRYAARNTGNGVGNAIAMIFRAIFTLIGAIIALFLLIILISVLFSGFEWAPVNNFLWTSDTQQMLGWGTLLFFIGAPIVGMLVWLGRKIFNIRTPGNYLSWMFSGLWAIGWVCLMFFLASFSKDFKRIETIEEEVAMQQPQDGTLIFKVSQPELEYAGNFKWLNENQNSMDGISLNMDSLKIATVRLGFQKSEDSLFHITIVKTALGKSDSEAMARAKNLKYNMAINDSVVDMENGYLINKKDKFRFQGVQILVKVPVGKQVKVDPSVFKKLINANFDFKNRRERTVEMIHHSREYRANTYYTMMDDGTLKSENSDDDFEAGSDMEGNDNYRWDGDLDSMVRMAPPAPPAPPSMPMNPDNKDTARVYHYNESPSEKKKAEELKKQIDQKQKELEELKKQFENQ